MRDDMRHVLVDRPRHKSYRDDAKPFRTRSHEDTPKKEGMRKPHRDRRSFSDHIKPLARFLRSNVGRLWNDVHSEICAHLTPSSTMQRHVFMHVDGYVETAVKLVDGVPYFAKGDRYGSAKIEGREGNPLFYVNPETGILCLAPRRKKYDAGKKAITLITVDRFTQFRLQSLIKYSNVKKMNEVVGSRWMVCELAQRPADKTETKVTYVANNVYSRESYTYTPGRDAFFGNPLSMFPPTESEKYYASPKLYCKNVRCPDTKELAVIARTLASVATEMESL